VSSTAYRHWRTVRASALHEIGRARDSAARAGSGRRTSNQQIIRAYAVLLASHFQGFCRDLHTECVDHILQVLAPPSALNLLLRLELSRGRQLDRGNAQPSSLGADFGRLGISFWKAVHAHDPASVAWQNDLELLNEWRNAIAHQDFTSPTLGGTINLRFSQVRPWRSSCGRLARTIDEVMRHHLQTLTGSSPW
jgi:hypothetical protein